MTADDSDAALQCGALSRDVTQVCRAPQYSLSISQRTACRQWVAAAGQPQAAVTELADHNTLALQCEELFKQGSGLGLLRVT